MFTTYSIKMNKQISIEYISFEYYYLDLMYESINYLRTINAKLQKIIIHTHIPCTEKN